MIDAGWYDWFCDDHFLKGKLDDLFPKVKQIANSKKIDMDKTYVFFKNNCPCEGTLYDDFRFCDMETGDVIYTVIPASGHESCWGQAELWGRENGFDKALVEGTWKEIKAFFGIEKRASGEYRNIGEWLEEKGQPLAAVDGNSVAVLEYDRILERNMITVFTFTETKNPFSDETHINVGSGWGIRPEHFGSLRLLLNSMEVTA
jgi:hypothetical protein